jgi:hypothetical protein
MIVRTREPEEKAALLRAARVRAALDRAELLEQIAEAVHAITADGLDPDGALTLEGSLVAAYRALRPAIDELLDGWTAR